MTEKKRGIWFLLPAFLVVLTSGAAVMMLVWNMFIPGLLSSLGESGRVGFGLSGGLLCLCGHVHMVLYVSPESYSAEQKIFRRLAGFVLILMTSMIFRVFLMFGI